MRRLLAVGLCLLGNAGVSPKPSSSADGMVATAPPALTPAAVTDLRVSAVTDTSAVLTWTEVPTGGGVARYALRYAPIGPLIWANQTDVLTGGCGAPVYGSTAGGGKTRSCVQGGLGSNLAYQFQIVAYTGVLNSTAVFGPLSNIAQATTAQRIGPMLVLRPRMLPDTIEIAEASDPYDFGPQHYPIHGKFLTGDRVTSFYDATGTLAAWGFLLVVKP